MADLSCPPSSTIRGTIQCILEQLVQLRAIASSPGGAASNDWLLAVTSVGPEVQGLLERVHYPLLLDLLGRNRENTSASSFQSGDHAVDAIYRIMRILDSLIHGGAGGSGSSGPAVSHKAVLSVDPLVSRGILLARGILGIMSVISADDVKEGRQSKLRTSVANPIHLHPVDIRSLLYLDLSNCSNLEEIPASIGTLHNLSALNLSWCYSLCMLPESLGGLQNLQILVLSSCQELLGLPSSLGNLTKLRFLDMSSCSRLVLLPNSFVNLVSLENLNLSHCKRLKALPQSFGNLHKLCYVSCHEVGQQVGYQLKLAKTSKLGTSSQCQHHPNIDVQGLPDSWLDLPSLLELQRWWKNNWVHRECTPKAASLHSYRHYRQGIIEMLVADRSGKEIMTSHEQNVTSICVAGQSGMGKTELVHQIYNDQMVLDAFDLRIWTCLSDKKRLIRKVVEFTTGAYCGAALPSFLEEIVQEELSGKRFLLVLDDADIEDQFFWSSVLSLVNVGSKGSTLVITTRSNKVAHLVGARQTYYLSSLSKKECFMIFQEHAFHGRDINSYPDLNKVGWQLVEKCGGNPMCVKALTGLLCHSESGFLELDTLVNDIGPALTHCYDVLPAHLKKCFRFCSLFPKYYIFLKHHIVHLWMSQGFIYPEEDIQLEDTGLRYFNELFCRSFFQRSPSHSDEEDMFVMHALFHDLAHYVSSNECFRSEDPFCSLPENICHLSLILLDSETAVPNLLTKEVGNLQSFLVISPSDLGRYNTHPPVLNILDLSDLFMKCRVLRTLNLSYTDIIELPSSIGNLKCLRFLALNNTNIKHLPVEIGNIDVLQTLEVKDCRYLVELPRSTWNLAKLRHLDVRKELGYVGMPFGIGQLTDLQTLSIFNVGNDSLYCSIGELKNLHGLRGRVLITGLEKIKTGGDAKEANLMGKYFIEALTLQWCCGSTDMEDDEYKDVANQVLQNLQPNNNLEELVIRNYAGNVFPIWIEGSSLHKLVSITFDGCNNCSNLPWLGDLPSLKYLFIQKMSCVNIFGHTSLATREKHAPRFPSLETLNLWEMYNLQCWIGIVEGDFPQLTRLSISRCPSLGHLPPFTSLVYLSFHCGTQLPTFSKIPSLKTLKIEGFQKIGSINISSEFPMLKKLEISNCKELLSVNAPALSISDLKIVRCPKLDLAGSLLKAEDRLVGKKASRRRQKRIKIVKTMAYHNHQVLMPYWDDGWSWRKYGRKDIPKCKYPRLYYKCRSKGCVARKIVQLSQPYDDDPITLLVTYRNEHNHQQSGKSAVDNSVVPGIELSVEGFNPLATLPKRKEFDEVSDESTKKKSKDTSSQWTCDTSCLTDISELNADTSGLPYISENVELYMMMDKDWS